MCDKRWYFQEKNFLEAGLFLLGAVGNVEHTIADGVFECLVKDGRFALTTDADIGLPMTTDYILFSHLIHSSQSQAWKTSFSGTPRAILEEIGHCVNSHSYELLRRMLERYSSLRLTFNESFYVPGPQGKNRKAHETRKFSFLSYKWRDTATESGRTSSEVIIELDRVYVDTIRGSKFTQALNLADIKKLVTPLAVRIYEWLSKGFYDKTYIPPYEVTKFGRDFQISKKYPSDILAKIEDAVEKVNQLTDDKYSVKLDEDKEKKKKYLHFKQHYRAARPTMTWSVEVVEGWKRIENMLPEEGRANNRTQICMAIERLGIEEVIKSIEASQLCAIEFYPHLSKVLKTGGATPFEQAFFERGYPDESR